jgi:hypothetical protein
MFDMTNDSNLFNSKEDLESKSFALQGNCFIRESNAEKYLPLYEAKLLNQYDHRQSTFEGTAIEDRFKMKAATILLSEEDKNNLNYTSIPRFWVQETLIQKLIPATWPYKWFIAFRNAVQMMTNARCAMFTILPIAGVGNSAPIILPFNAKIKNICTLIANFNSMIFDYATRQSIGGGNLNFYIIKQLPTFSPNHYSSELISMIAPKVFELTYTAWDIKAFADDLWREADEPLHAALKQQWDENVAETDGGHANAEPPSWAEIAPDGFPYPPFKWDEERRARLRAELDAISAHLYGLTREELDYILETFPIVKRKDIERYGSYRTKEMILRYYEEHAGRFSRQA